MANKKNNQSTVIVSVLVGALVGAVGTAFFSSEPPLQKNASAPNTNQAFGVGGGDVLPQDLQNVNQNDSNDNSNSAANTNDSDDAVGEKKNTEENKSVEKTDTAEHSIDTDDTVNQNDSVDNNGFTYASLVQPEVEKIDENATIYRYGDENVISVISGEAKETALSSIVVQNETDIRIDGKDAKYIDALSIRDGQQESYVVIEDQNQLLLARGTKEFLDSLQTDLSL